MSGPATEGVKSQKQKLPLNPIDLGVPRFNAATNKYESVPMGGGSFDPNANYNPTGQWVFSNQPYIGTVDPANQLTTLIGVQTMLAAYPTTVAVSLALAGKVDTATYNAYVTSNNAAVALKADTSALSSYALLAGVQTFTDLNTFRRNLNVGTATTAVARIHVRGDGTLPIARFEDTAGSTNVSISNTAQAITITEGAGATTLQLISGNTTLMNNGNNTFTIQTGTGTLQARIAMNAGGFAFASRDLAATAAGTNSNYTFNTNINPAAGAATFRVLNLPYIINASGAQTGVLAGICINATETNLNGLTHRFVDFQISGTSKFYVLNDGTTQLTGDVRWGTSASEPMIRRNGSGIDFKLADNSAYADIRAGVANFNSIQFNSGGIKLIPNGAGILGLNGINNAAPAFKVSGTKVSIRLGDDSGFGTIQGIFQATTTAVAETVTQTHTLLITDAIGGQYKILLSSIG